MGQQVTPPCRHLARLFAPFPCRTRRGADSCHQLCNAVEHRQGQRGAAHAEHGRGQHDRIGRYHPVDQRAHDDMPAHGMRGQHVRSGRGLHPVRPEMFEIGHPIGEIFDVTCDRIIAQPARSCLPAPVGGGDAPAAAVPPVERLEVFLVEVAAPRQEQDRSALSLALSRPVYLAQRVTVGCLPHAFGGAGRNGAPVDGGGICLQVGLADGCLPVLRKGHGYYLVSMFE